MLVQTNSVLSSASPRWTTSNFVFFSIQTLKSSPLLGTLISFITHISSKPSTDMTSAGIYGKFRPYNTTLLEPAPHPPHRRANEGVRFPITNGSLFANQNSRNQPPGKNFNVHNKGEILGRRGFRAEIEKSNWNPASNDFME